MISNNTLFPTDKDKLISSFLYVAETLVKRRGKLSADIHRVFKIMYFADQKHLVKYGRPITTDYYDALPYGPVPSNAYEIVKTVRGETIFRRNINGLENLFEINNVKFITPKQSPDLDELSKSDFECLDESIRENYRLSFIDLTKKSHDGAWNAACTKGRVTLSFQDIAKAGGAKKAMIAYIKEQLENSYLLR